MNDRTTMSSSSAWDSDVLPTDPDIAPTVLDRTDDASDDPEVEQLVSDIERTRSEMTGTVDELGERLDPARIAEKTGEKVRAATIGKVEMKVDEMTNAASTLAANAGDTVQQTGSGVIETIRRNPVPAALAGFGIGWLVLNRQTAQNESSVWAGRRTPAGWTTGDIPRSERRDVGDAVGARAREASAAVGDAAANASQAARDAAYTVGESASEAASTVTTTATSMASTAQRAMESNPLAAGAIAIAVGAAVGLALPASRAEKRVMGQTGSQLIDRAESAVTKPLEDLETASNR